MLWLNWVSEAMARHRTGPTYARRSLIASEAVERIDACL